MKTFAGERGKIYHFVVNIYLIIVSLSKAQKLKRLCFSFRNDVLCYTILELRELKVLHQLYSIQCSFNELLCYQHEQCLLSCPSSSGKIQRVLSVFIFDKYQILLEQRSRPTPVIVLVDTL